MTPGNFWLVVALLVVCAVVGNTLLLWLTSRIVRVKGVTLTRILAATALVWTVNLASVPRRLLDAGNDFAYLLSFAVLVLVAFFALKWAFRSGTGRTLLALVVFGTLEVVVWLPTAYLIRSELLEAFSIPTGGMAPTVVGVHLESPCSNCGFSIIVGARTSPEGELELPSGFEEAQVSCPSCLAPNPCKTFSITEGDRVLIDKTVGAARWNPIAFTTPHDLGMIDLRRLVGLPGETIEISRGDVFANNQRLVKQPGTAEDMWILIHDSAHRPASDGEANAVWTTSPEESSWKRSGTGWQYSDRTADEQLLQYAGPLTNDLVYNSLIPGMLKGESVSDVKLTCVVSRFEGAGRLGVLWEYGDAAAEARLSSAGDFELMANGQTKTASEGVPDLGGADVSFGVRDGQAFLSVNGRVMAALQVFPSDLEQLDDQRSGIAPRCRLSLVASNCELTLSRVRVMKDIHYQAGRVEPCNGCTGSPIDLGPDEFYVLGDNTRSSNDSRYWRQVDPGLPADCQPGAVPGDLILGPLRAIFWPRERWRYFSTGW